jgi:peptide/nickel transport system substrate-binding protein
MKQFHTSGEPHNAYDPKKAEALLDEAGLKRKADGKRFKMMLDFVPLGSDYQRSAEMIKQQLARVGVDVEIRTQDLPTWTRRVYTDHDFDATANYIGAYADPRQGTQRVYWSKAIAKGVPFVNVADYRSPEMDQALEAAQIENDPKKRWAQYAEVQRIARTDLPVLPLMEMKFFTVASKKLKNHTITADGICGGNFANTWLEK